MAIFFQQIINALAIGGIYALMSVGYALIYSLAGMSLVLSADGVDPKMGERLLDKRVVRTMKTLMFTCDMYDESGEYACRVGIPSKVVWVRRYYGLCRRMYGHWMLWPRP